MKNLLGLTDAESKNILFKITQSARDAIVLMDSEGCIAFWNPAAETLFGWNESEAVGCKLHELLAPDHYRERFVDTFSAFQKTGQGNAVGKTLELPGLRKDGREMVMELSLSAMEIEGAWHGVGIVRDVTLRKGMERELQMAKEQLEQANARLEDALVKAQEMALQAEVANRAKSEFLANISHEIRTPMNGVIGMTEVLMETELQPEQRGYLDIVRKSGTSLLTIINDILDFSKIEAGKMSLENLSFDLRITLEDIVDMMALEGLEKGLELVCLIDPEVPSLLRGDPGRLRQVLLNLIGNSVKFTAQGEVSLQVKLETETAEFAQVLFEVTDTGPGIPGDKIAQLFTPFTQADGSIARKHGGTGLGLSIAKRLVNMMGGDIGVESLEGRGARFWFTARFSKQEHVSDVTPATLSLAGRHVLIADGSSSVRQVFRVVLCSWGATVGEARDAKEVWAALEKGLEENKPYDSVILDVYLQGESAEHLGRRIKQDERFSKAHLILLTSLGKRGDGELYHEVGFAAYLQKPVKMHQIMQCFSLLFAPYVVDKGVEPPAFITRHTLTEAERHHHCILIVEDNPVNQIVTRTILEKYALQSEVVNNGLSALEALRKKDYDLVLMDCQMPEMDGYDATQVIRNPNSGVRNSRIPIIAMTAHAFPDERQKCIESGMDDFISKPVNPKVMVEMIQGWLARAKSANAEEKNAENLTAYFDEADFLNRLMDDREIGKTLIEAFFGEITGRMTELDQVIFQENLPGIQNVAHALKGLAGNMSAFTLRDAAGQLEDAAEAQNREGIPGLFAEVRKQATLTQRAMSKSAVYTNN
ncbi:TPA: hypothetical protein DDW35_01565 [Candidatus Sumerlaeota bacterium]|nr:hypothetical protein [Candidatus Sumerlaeota bacterium]